MISEIMAIKNKKVNRVMIQKNEVVTVAHDIKLRQVIEIYQQNHFSRYPVYYQNIDHIVGILHIKDIVVFWHECRDFPVIEFVRLPHFLYEDRSILDVFLELQRLRLSMAIVIDEFGGVSGAIAIEDLIEEIVGDIEDEFDRLKKPLMERISEDEFIVNARMELDDFAEHFGIHVDEDDISTVAGLISKHADRIPRMGEEISYKNLKFTILEGTRKNIIKVRVKQMG